jgi:Fe-S-cluster containining protein
VDEFDCQACGACCYGDDGWVHVDAADDARVDASERLRALVVMTRMGSYVRRSLRMLNGRCAGLADTDTGVTCSVYADRPTVCRALKAGSEDCVRARRARWGEPGEPRAT